MKIENDLIELVPKKDWIIFSHLLIFHGRRICKARQPAVRRVCGGKTLSFVDLENGKGSGMIDRIHTITRFSLFLNPV